MARIYQTRQLLDPSMFGQMNQSLAQQYQAGHNYNQGMANAISQGLQGVGTAAQGAYDRYKQNQAIDERKQTIAELLNSNDPAVRAAAEQYAREGNASGLLQLKMYEQTQAARNAELLQRQAELKAKDEQKLGIDLENAKANYGQLQNDYLTALQGGDVTKAEIIANKLNAMDNEWSQKTGKANPFGDTAEQMKSAFDKQQLINRLKNEDEIARQSEANDYAIKLKSKMQKAKSFEQKQAILKEINDDQAYFTPEEKLELKKELQNVKTLGEKKKEGTEGAVAGHAAKQTTDKLEEKSAKKKLADAGREALSKGRRPTRAQQKAMDEGN